MGEQISNNFYKYNDASLIGKLRVVTIDNPYLCAPQSPLARDLYGELLRLRAEGYGPEYPSSFLPLDKADYISWHHLYCLEEEGRFVPIAGFRQVPLKRCDFYQIDMPLLETVKRAGADMHMRALENIIKQHRNNVADMVYSSGLTIRKPYKGNKDLSFFIREMGAALTYVDMLEHCVGTLVTGAVIRFGTHIWFQNVGYEPLTWRGDVLPPIRKDSAGGEPMLLMHLSKISDWSKACLEKYRQPLKSRIQISASSSQLKQAA